MDINHILTNVPGFARQLFRYTAGYNLIVRWVCIYWYNLAPQEWASSLTYSGCRNYDVYRWFMDIHRLNPEERERFMIKLLKSALRHEHIEAFFFAQHAGFHSWNVIWPWVLSSGRRDIIDWIAPRVTDYTCDGPAIASLVKKNHMDLVLALAPHCSELYEYAAEACIFSYPNLVWYFLDRTNNISPAFWDKLNRSGDSRLIRVTKERYGYVEEMKKEKDIFWKWHKTIQKKRWDILEERCHSVVPMYAYSLASYSLEACKIIEKTGCPMDAAMYYGPAERGNVELIRYCHEKGYPWNYLAYKGALKGGQIEVLDYLYHHDCPFDARALKQISHYHLEEMLEWLHAHNFPQSPLAYLSVISPHTLNILHQYGYPVNEDIAYRCMNRMGVYGIDSRNGEMIAKWFRYKGIKLD